MSALPRKPTSEGATSISAKRHSHSHQIAIYSITSSARAIIESGMLRPSVFAALGAVLVCVAWRVKQMFVLKSQVFITELNT